MAASSRFNAFISYSRGSSAGLAGQLQSAIERFAKPWYKLRAVRIFRDDSSMSANTSLWSTIEQALTESDWFVLVASPAAAASKWVTAEIEWWLEHKGAERILIVLDEGTLFWDGAANDFDWARSTAVGRVLSGVFPEEPRWVELDWFEAEGSLGTEDPRWIERVADLAAAIRFTERDQLVGENVREHRKAQRLLRAGVAALSMLLVASLVATVIAVIQGNEARDQARISLARQLAAQALALRPTDIQLASLLAVAAHRMHDDEQTQAALFQTATASPQLDRTLQAGQPVVKVAGAADASIVVAGTETGAVLAWDTATGQRTELGSLSGMVAHLAVSDDGAVVAATRPTDARAWVVGAESSLGAGGDAVAVSPDGQRIAVFDGAGTELFQRRGAGFEAAGRVEAGAPVMSFGASGELVFVDRAGRWGRLDLAVMTVIESGELAFPISNQGIALSGDGERIALAAGGTDYPVYGTHGPSELGDSALLTTSQIAGPLGLALSDDGALMAAIVDHAIYVSAVRERGELAEAPRLLDGSGKTTPNALEFLGRRYLVSVSGSQVLLWDLAQTSRITRSFEAPVPEDCRACGPPLLAVSPDGSRAVAVTRSGLGAFVLIDGETESGISFDDRYGAMAAVWLDDERLAYFDSVERALMVVSGPQLATVDSSTPLDVGGVLALVPLDEQSVGVLAQDGSWLEVGSAGDVAARSTELSSLLEADPNAPAYAIAPDGSTAFIAVFGQAELQITTIDTASGALLYSGEGAGAAYAQDSVLRVFAQERVWQLDTASGTLRADSVPASVDTLPPPLLSPDGRVLVHGGLDGSIEFTDLRRWGSSLGSMAVPDQENAYSFSGFSGDGALLYTAVQPMEANGYVSSVRVTDMTIEGWIAALCATAGRELTEQEWAIYSDQPLTENLRCAP